MKAGVVCNKSYDNPWCPVFVVEGNGGVPGQAHKDCNISDCDHMAPWCRTAGKGDTKACGAYGRITIPNAETLTYEHVANSNGKVLDSFTITQRHHGSFEHMPTNVDSILCEPHNSSLYGFCYWF